MACTAKCGKGYYVSGTYWRRPNELRVIQIMQIKALVMHSFMFETNERYAEEMAAEVKPGNLEILYRHASNIAERVGTRYAQASGSWVYNMYPEYHMHKSQDGIDSAVGKFNKFDCGH